jgi:membrane-bound serine protease (ClpP class)
MGWIRVHGIKARRAVALAAIVLALAILAAGGGRAGPEGHAALLTIDGPIGPGVSDYVHRGIDQAVDGGATIVILQMDTPGGLDTSMREIIKAILAAPVPVAGFVGPSGARAASAGTYILYASHVAIMAPGTNLGAATPVQLGGGQPPPEADKDGDKDGDKNGDKDGDKDEKAADGKNDDETAKDEDSESEEKDESAEPAHPTLSDKALNDAIAYIRSLAQMRGRNAEWAVKAVREAASLSAEDALEQGVIDLMADNIEDLLVKIDGREVEVGGHDRTLETAGLEVREIEADWRTQFLEIITNPTVAYLLLFTIGVPALLLEFYTGTLVAGVVGAICIMLGLYGLHLLPIDFAGAALIALGLALLVAEAFVPSFGVLGIGGVVSFVVGSVMLIDTDVPGLGISPWVIGAVAAAAAGMMVMIATLLIRSRDRPVVSGREAMRGGAATIIDWADGAGHVRIQGEIWQARSADAGFAAGAPVRVKELDGLTLVVEPEITPEQES